MVINFDAVGVGVGVPGGRGIFFGWGLECMVNMPSNGLLDGLMGVGEE